MSLGYKIIPCTIICCIHAESCDVKNWAQYIYKAEELIQHMTNVGLSKYIYPNTIVPSKHALATLEMLRLV